MPPIPPTHFIGIQTAADTFLIDSAAPFKFIARITAVLDNIFVWITASILQQIISRADIALIVDKQCFSLNWIAAATKILFVCTIGWVVFTPYQWLFPFVLNLFEFFGAISTLQKRKKKQQIQILSTLHQWFVNGLTFPHKLIKQYVSDKRKIIVKTTRRRNMRTTAAYHII